MHETTCCNAAPVMTVADSAYMSKAQYIKPQFALACNTIPECCIVGQNPSPTDNPAHSDKGSKFVECCPESPAATIP